MFLITSSKRVELIYRYKVSALRCSSWPAAVEMSLTVLLFSPNCFLFFLASLQRDPANPEVTPYKILQFQVLISTRFELLIPLINLLSLLLSSVDNYR